MMIRKMFVNESNLAYVQINNVPLKNHKTTTCIQKLLASTVLIMATSVVKAAPHAVSDNTTHVTLNNAVWPSMKHHDIWNDDKQFLSRTNEIDFTEENIYENIEMNSRQFLKNFVLNDIESNNTERFKSDSKRKSKGMKRTKDTLICLLL